jgi:hypothetical protein
VLVPGGVTVADLVRLVGARCAVDKCFQAAENETALEHYQVRIRPALVPNCCCRARRGPNPGWAQQAIEPTATLLPLRHINNTRADSHFDIRLRSEYTGDMTAEPADAVTFSDLSRNPRAVAERARRLGRLRVTHRDAADFYLTAADREEERDENLMTASRMFAALSRSEAGTQAVESAIAEVFPWTRHLSAAERSQFAAQVVAALSDAAELTVDGNAHEVIAGWRATARIKADKSLYARALAETEGDLGPVEVIA